MKNVTGGDILADMRAVAGNVMEDAQAEKLKSIGNQVAKDLEGFIEKYKRADKNLIVRIGKDFGDKESLRIDIDLQLKD